MPRTATSSSLDAAAFAGAVLDWYAHSGRKDLPWQQNKTPYRVWISEIMLQQTQVQTVIPYYEKFMQRFPDVQALAAAPVDEVLALWSGLGYYSRARNLHACAQQIVREFGGEFPARVDEVSTLRGIGRSTAGAILSLSRNTRAAIFDGNVKRVLCRVLGLRWFDNPRRHEIAMWQLAETLVPDNAADYNQAMMDLGATLCARTRPDCTRCPLQTICVAAGDRKFADYPGSKPKKQAPIKQTRLLILRRGDEVLLQQRPPAGIWGGLWVLPEIDAHLSPAEQAAALGLPSTQWQALAPFRHTFSHFHLDIAAFAGRLLPVALPALASSRIMPASVHDAAQRWQPLSELDSVGLPAPIRRLLDQIRELP